MVYGLWQDTRGKRIGYMAFLITLVWYRLFNDIRKWEKAPRAMLFQGIRRMR